MVVLVLFSYECMSFPLGGLLIPVVIVPFFLLIPGWLSLLPIPSSWVRMLASNSTMNKYLQDYNSCLRMDFSCLLFIEVAIGLAPLLYLISDVTFFYIWIYYLVCIMSEEWAWPQLFRVAVIAIVLYFAPSQAFIVNLSLILRDDSNLDNFV